eukprot:TRINITY_DN31548_c0_g1_i1.p1 TRINITY_DN31548_c0_g1~~TRINITY_DN31548_c0_g1_i1.p1  ORF type:complete len:160 (-),score=36.08 TRINITY_DN31548_c0_g1_i1:223-702(-)
MVSLTSVLYNSFKPTNPKSLYKFLLRSCSVLPPDAAKFYRVSVRKEYEQHREEEDPERVEQIMERAVKDAEWILNKYKTCQVIKMAALPLRTQVIRLYSRILKVGRGWKAQDINETKVERQYIQDEAKLLFRKNKNLKNASDIEQSLVEAEARLTMAEH